MGVTTDVNFAQQFEEPIDPDFPAEMARDAGEARRLAAKIGDRWGEFVERALLARDASGLASLLVRLREITR